MVWLIIASIACLMIGSLLIVFKEQQDFYLDQKEVSRNNASLRRFVRYGAIYFGLGIDVLRKSG
ncbi:hypothetical protein [Fictibacillus sp. UD]|uniref:hypothetical protein n=1 Tax=Fictibacillus sp. UD TaxID=3038777 RepID=UPI003749B8B7